MVLFLDGEKEYYTILIIIVSFLGLHLGYFVFFIKITILNHLNYRCERRENFSTTTSSNEMEV